MGNEGVKRFGLNTDIMTRTEDSVAGVVAAVRSSVLLSPIHVHLAESFG